MTFREHLYRWHGGNWRNPSHGVPVNPQVAPDFSPSVQRAMPNVALLIEDLGGERARALALLRQTLGLGLGELQRAVAASAPLTERPLFDRADPGFAGRLADALDALDAIGARARAYEVPSGERYAPGASAHELTPKQLRTMIATREASMAEQWRYAERTGEAG